MARSVIAFTLTHYNCFLFLIPEMGTEPRTCNNLSKICWKSRFFDLMSELVDNLQVIPVAETSAAGQLKSSSGPSPVLLSSLSSKSSPSSSAPPYSPPPPPSLFCLSILSRLSNLRSCIDWKVTLSNSRVILGWLNYVLAFPRASDKIQSRTPHL